MIEFLAVILFADERCDSGRIYSRSIIDQIVDQAQAQIQGGSCLGWWAPPVVPAPLHTAAFRVIDAFVRDERGVAYALYIKGLVFSDLVNRNDYFVNLLVSNEPVAFGPIGTGQIGNDDHVLSYNLFGFEGMIGHTSQKVLRSPDRLRLVPFLC